MSRTRLTAEQRSELLTVKDARSTHPKVRRWIEMVLLSAEGWTCARIAEHLGLSEKGVQERVRCFNREGMGSLVVRYPEGRGNGTMRKLTPAYLEALRKHLESDVLYTAERLRDALAEETGVEITTDHLRELIGREGYGWKRTKRSVAHSRNQEVFVEFLEQLPRPFPDRPVYVVVDNYSIHKAKRIRERLDALAASGLNLFFLPPYSPELNDIEPCWRYIKHQGMEVRLFQS